MSNSCKCKLFNDSYPVTKCSNCGCVHYKSERPPCQSKSVKDGCWVDRDSVPKRKDIVPLKKCGDNQAALGSRRSERKSGSLNQPRSARQPLQDPQPRLETQSRVSEQKRTSGEVQTREEKSKKPESRKNSKKSQKQTPPAPSQPRTSGSAPSPAADPMPAPVPAPTQAPASGNGGNGKRTSFVLPDEGAAKQGEPQPGALRPSTSKSEQIICKDFTDKFSGFLKKVKSTEMFIRNLFKEETNSKSSSCPSTDNRQTCGVCLKDASKTISELIGVSGKSAKNSNQKSDPCGAGGRPSSQNDDLLEIKNTVESLKEMMCKQSQSGCPFTDETFQRVLAELRKYVQQDTIEKLLKAPSSNAIALIGETTEPFVFVKARPFCDQHGIFIVEWKVSSFLGIGGYEIYVDGILKESINSAIRNTALIPGVNPKSEHLVTITAVPLAGCDLNSNDKWTPANCRYKPTCF